MKGGCKISNIHAQSIGYNTVVLYYHICFLGTRSEDYISRQCTARNNANIINITIFSFKAILQFIGVILAFQTRLVKIRVLNNCIYVSSIIYISTIAIFSTAAITVALGALLNVTELVYSGALFIAKFYSKLVAS